MTCRELADFLMDYLDGSLPEPVRAHFEEHLPECPDCMAYLATYEQAVRIGKAVCLDGEQSLHPSVPEELVRAILSARSRQNRAPEAG